MITQDDEPADNLRKDIEKALEDWLLPAGASEQDESPESGAWMRWMALVPPKKDPSQAIESDNENAPGITQNSDTEPN